MPRGSREAAERAGARLTPDKKVILVSDATGVGWIDSAEGTAHVPTNP